MDAEVIPGKEGCVIRDIVSGEALKLFPFGEGTQAGQLFFQGRHGDRERVAEYIYLFDSEVRPDGRRLPMLHRAKSIYGDRFDENGPSLGKIKGLGADWTQGLAGVNSTIPIPPGRMEVRAPCFPQVAVESCPCPGAFSLTAREGWLRLAEIFSKPGMSFTSGIGETIGPWRKLP